MTTPTLDREVGALPHICYFCRSDCKGLSLNCCPDCAKRFIEPAATLPPPASHAAEWPIPGIWRHFKGGRYRLHHIARHSETSEAYVVYEALYETPSGFAMHVRPLRMWSEHVTRDGYSGPRFTYEGPAVAYPPASEVEGLARIFAQNFEPHSWEAWQSVAIATLEAGYRLRPPAEPQKVEGPPRVSAEQVEFLEHNQKLIDQIDARLDAISSRHRPPAGPQGGREENKLSLTLEHCIERLRQAQNYLKTAVVHFDEKTRGGMWGCIAGIDGAVRQAEAARLFAPLQPSERGEVVALLDSIEWACGDAYAECPSCGENDEGPGHRPDCRLASLRARLASPPEPSGVPKPVRGSTVECPEHGELCHGAECCCKDKHPGGENAPHPSHRMVNLGQWPVLACSFCGYHATDIGAQNPCSSGVKNWPTPSPAGAEGEELGRYILAARFFCIHNYGPEESNDPSVQALARQIKERSNDGIWKDYLTMADVADASHAAELERLRAELKQTRRFLEDANEDANTYQRKLHELRRAIGVNGAPDALEAAKRLKSELDTARAALHRAQSDERERCIDIVRNGVGTRQTAEQFRRAVLARLEALPPAAPGAAAPPKESTMRQFSLRHLQAHLPWTLPYSPYFEISIAAGEPHRNLAHDMAHVVKSLGKVAAVCEDFDHGRPPTRYKPEELADAVADLVICALHMAKTSPLGAFDLEAVVVAKLEDRNGVTIPKEPAPHPEAQPGAGVCPHCEGTQVLRTHDGAYPCPCCRKTVPTPGGPA